MSANPNHHYFDGFYQLIWQQIIPPALTQKEVEHVLAHFQLNATTPVLDLMCGYGRHALALATQGIPVTAIDNQPSYIDQIETQATEQNLPLTAICSNALDWNPVPQHQLALCMGNSLNFFSPAELPVFLQKVSASLLPGGYFWINSWSISEIALQDPLDGETLTTQLGDFSHTNTFHLKTDPLRIEIESRIEDAKGNREEKLAIDYLYSIPVLSDALKQAGLDLLVAESIPGKRSFEKGDPRVYILSQKP